MATTFKKLGEVDVIETFADTSTVLVEEDGDIKRIALEALLSVYAGECEEVYAGEYEEVTSNE